MFVTAYIFVSVIYLFVSSIYEEYYFSLINYHSTTLYVHLSVIMFGNVQNVHLYQAFPGVSGTVKFVNTRFSEKGLCYTMLMLWQLEG